MKKNILLKINKDLPPTYKAGDEIITPIDDYGIIKDEFLRKRAKDAAIDNCISIIKKSPKVSVSKNNQSQQK